MSMKDVDEFLFGRGLTVGDYFIEQTPVSELLCYRNSEGREFDLPINDDAFAGEVLSRLKELGVRIVKVS
ncbi:hypothetical protein ACQUKI_15940 [Ralstonia pseudosolanacearum]